MNQQQDIYIVAIDGPVGSGKGTIGQKIARHYSWHYLDSGALYRAFSHAANKKGIACENTAGLRALYNTLSINFLPTADGGAAICVNGEDVTDTIRQEDAGKLASEYAARPAVRKLLFELQRQAARAPGLVADGRDMGSVVFPEADLKIFLTASVEDRAQRRYKQLKLKNFDVNLTRLVQGIRDRDQQDAMRKHSPLVPAADAVIIDTSSMAIEQVFNEIVALIEASNRDK